MSRTSSSPSDDVADLQGDDSGDVSQFLQQGHARYRQYDYERAIAYYTSALQLNPYLVEAYLWRARAHRYNEELREAIADYSEAIRCDPKLAEAYYERAELRKKAFDLRGAIADYERFLDLCRDLCEEERVEVQQSIQDLRKQLGL